MGGLEKLLGCFLLLFHLYCFVEESILTIVYVSNWLKAPTNIILCKNL